MADEVIIDFIGNKDPLDKTVSQAKSELADLSKAPVNVDVSKATQPTISYWRNATEQVKLSAAQQRAEAIQNAELEARVEKSRTERLAAYLRQREAEEYASNERRLRALSEVKHQEYLADKAAEEAITDTQTKESGKRSGFLTGSQPLRGFGGLFRATGLYQYGISEMEINAALNIFNKITGRSEDVKKATEATVAAATADAGARTVSATAAEGEAVAAGEAAVATEATATAAAATAVSFGVVAGVILPLVAVGYVLYDLSKSYRQEKEQQLKVEEAIAAAVNRQRQYQKDLTDELKKQRGEAATSREVETFKAGFGSQQTSDLEQRKADLEALLKNTAPSVYNQTTKQYELTIEQQNQRNKYTKELIALEDELYRRQHTNDVSFSNLGDNAIKDREEAAKKFQKDVEEATKKVQELVKTWTSGFEGLYTRANSDNPFVKQMLDNADATRKFKEEAALLPPELQSVGYSLIKQAGDLAVYKLQIDAAFKAIDLRSQAARFGGKTPEELKRDFIDAEAERRRTSNSTNPDVFRSSVLEQFRIGILTREQATQALYQTANSPDAARYYRDLLRNSFSQEEQKTQNTLDQQLNLARGAKTESQRDEVEARIAATARSLDPNKLRNDQRRDLQQIFERQAVLTERRQNDAYKVQQDLLKIWQDIQKNGLKLQGNVNQSGKDALQITVKDELKNSQVTRATSATDEDTANFYNTNPGQGTFFGEGRSVIYP